MKRFVPAAFVAVVLLLGAAASAHHSQAQYEDQKQVSVKGKVTKYSWMNPHVWIFVDTMDEQGKVKNWGFEANSASTMSRSGWTRKQFAPGEEVAVIGWPMRDGTPKALLNKITGPDGKTLVLAGNGPQKPR